MGGIHPAAAGRIPEQHTDPEFDVLRSWNPAFRAPLLDALRGRW
jgi:hypothetical protein